jgi:NADPH-dependent 2,4-dienoyl-CoA reductase/sulfur reductase-like enzyme
MAMRRKVVIVGAGPAGCAAALAAAELGLEVTLVDEHPQVPAAMSLDAPYFYGARLPAVLSNEAEIADRVFGANEALMECLEAGVDVLVGTSVWGVFRPGPNSRHLAGSEIGLADRERSWMLPFDHLVIAAGARDLVLSFPGWELPGVVGVMGASALLNRYAALGGRRILVLGTGNAALAFARDARAAGLELAGLVGPTAAIEGDAELARALVDDGVPFLLGKTIERALGDGTVNCARLLGFDGAVIAGSGTDIPCDTVCLAFGTVPNIELPAVAGCEIVFDPARGGWAPRLDETMETSLSSIFVVGDAAGVDEVSRLAPARAVAQARQAVAEIARREGLADAPAAVAMPTRAGAYPPELWMESLIASGGDEVVVCQCETVTRRELVAISAPRYLGATDAAPPGAVGMLTVGGRPNQDSLKRLTRAGMGHCQGKRCRDHAAMLLARAVGVAVGDVVPGSYGVPVRPIPLNVMAPDDESAETRATWPVWLHPVAEDGCDSGGGH